MAWQFRGHSPVYRQIVRHIRADILNGCYQPDEQIPPVRQLAMEAGVNPNTMQRALSALEDEGLLVSRGTVGRFVTSDEAALERARRTARQDALEKLAEDAQAAGLTLDDLVQYIREEAQSAAIPSTTLTHMYERS